MQKEGIKDLIMKLKMSGYFYGDRVSVWEEEKVLEMMVVAVT